jgi:hypothetical protein
MSAFGTKRTSQYAPPMSAFGGKADIAATERNFNYGFRKAPAAWAIFAAIRRASSRVSSLAVDLRSARLAITALEIAQIAVARSIP